MNAMRNCYKNQVVYLATVTLPLLVRKLATFEG